MEHKPGTFMNFPDLDHLRSFDHRINRQIGQIYDALPEVSGIHFTQASQLDSIKDEGFVSENGRPNFVYLFDKRDTDEYYGDRLQEVDDAGLEHYGKIEMLKRFHAAFVEGLNKYGLEALRGHSIKSPKEVYDFLVAHKDDLPAVVFADLTDTDFSQKNKDKNKLSQAYFNGLSSENIMKTLSLDDGDFKKISEDCENGIPLEKAFKKIFVNKATEWLLLLVEEKREKELRVAEEEYLRETLENKVSDWRMKYDEEFGAEFVDGVIRELSEQVDMRAGGVCIRTINGETYVTPSGRFVADIFINQNRGGINFRKKLKQLAPENRKVAENLVVHSFGGDDLIRFNKILVAEQVQALGNEKFGRNVDSIIYFGSCDDAELAILSGAGKIYLVDPALNNDLLFSGMIERLKTFAKNVSVDDSDNIRITFENRDIDIFIYPQTMEEFNQSVGIKAEAVVMYNKGPGMDTAEAEKALVEGGICVDNRRDFVS